MAYTHDWWRKALANPHLIGSPDLPVHEAEPQCGYYRKRVKDGEDLPAAIWFDKETGELLAKVGQKPADAGAIWTWVCRSPISYDEFLAAFEGKGWPDDPPSAPIGHNIPDDPAEALKQELEGERELAEAFLARPIASKTDADMAATWAKKLAAISSRADTQRKAEKQPHMDAAKSVDDRWRDIVDVGKDFATRLKRHLDAWLREQDRLEQERQRKAREEAEKARRDADAAAAKAAAEARSDADRQAAEQAAQDAADRAAAAERDAQARNATAGRTGARVALRTFVSAKVTDYDAALTALKTHPEIKALVETLANRAVKAGHELPGVERIEERRAA